MKYEYKVLQFDAKGWISRKVDSNEMETQLNLCGAEGWELSHITEVHQDHGDTAMLVATLRRQVV